jgi:predicted PolB exonuclease-like 3'-5' exonuclease
MGLPGKPDGMSGAEVEKYYRAGHIREIAGYRESDVINTYRIWLRYELFVGRLTDAEVQASEAYLSDFLGLARNWTRRIAMGRFSAREVFIRRIDIPDSGSEADG